jgi:hypothetical protein
MTTNGLSRGILRTDSFCMPGHVLHRRLGTRSLEGDQGPAVTRSGVAGMGEPLVMNIMETARGAFMSAMGITAGACVAGIIPTAVARPPKPVAEAA